MNVYMNETRGYTTLAEFMYVQSLLEIFERGKQWPSGSLNARRKSKGLFECKIIQPASKTHARKYVSFLSRSRRFFILQFVRF